MRRAALVVEVRAGVLAQPDEAVAAAGGANPVGVQTLSPPSR